MPPKAGFFTSEFWLSAVSILAAALVGVLQLTPAALAKLPPPWGGLAGALAGVVVPLVIGWITHRYIGSRTDIKLAAAQAGAAAPVTALNR